MCKCERCGVRREMALARLMEGKFDKTKIVVE
jgi:hypothetical protein